MAIHQRFVKQVYVGLKCRVTDHIAFICEAELPNENCLLLGSPRPTPRFGQPNATARSSDLWPLLPRPPLLLRDRSSLWLREEWGESLPKPRAKLVHLILEGRLSLYSHRWGRQGINMLRQTDQKPTLFGRAWLRHICMSCGSQRRRGCSPQID